MAEGYEQKPYQSEFAIPSTLSTTAVKSDLTFGSQNIVYKYGRIVFCTLVFQTTEDASQNTILFTVPYTIRFPFIVSIRRDEDGGMFLIGSQYENTNNVAALYGAGLPTGIYRTTFSYITTL